MTTTGANDGERPTARYGDQEVVRPQGGETHQAVDGTRPRLTTQQGIPVTAWPIGVALAARKLRLST